MTENVSVWCSAVVIVVIMILDMVVLSLTAGAIAVVMLGNFNPGSNDTSDSKIAKLSVVDITKEAIS